MSSAMKSFLIAMLVAPSLASAQDAAQVRRMYEAGQYQQVVETAAVYERVAGTSRAADTARLPGGD